jgi:hypothetical protein
MGVFDKNTALIKLYVDMKRKGLGNRAQEGEQLGNGCMRTRGHASAREVASGEGLTALKPHFSLRLSGSDSIAKDA